MIPFKNRFHGHNSLRFVYKNGQAIRSRLITIKTISNQHRKQTRIAVVVSKKVFKKAVQRNRVRRQIYEYARIRLLKNSNIYDIAIIISSGEILTTPHNEMIEMLNQLFLQAGL